MPNKDGTGPLGQGAKTGRKLGNCKNNSNDFEKLGFFGRMFRNRKGKGRRGGKRNGNGQGQGKGYGNGNQQK